MLIIVILLVMSAASKLVDIASKLDWYQFRSKNSSRNACIEFKN